MKMIALIFSLVLAFAMPAAAQSPCGPRLEFLNELRLKYKEVPVAMGLTANGGVIELLVSEIGSWTLIITMPNSLTCGFASGQSWEAWTPRAKPPPEIEPIKDAA